MPALNSRSIEVLLVENIPGDVRLTEEAFQEGHVVKHLRVVRDGVEASDFLWRRGEFATAPRPDLILLDLNPLAEIKADPELRRIPVMELTTSRAEQDLLRAYNLHANCCITKPDGLDQFLDMIRAIEHFWFNVVTLPSD